jgi:putative transposase
MLAELTDEERRRAWERWTIIQPFFDAGVPLTRLAATHARSSRTLGRWVRAYRQSGLRGLARKGRADAGTRRVRPELHQLIEGLVLTAPAPSGAVIVRRVQQVARREGWPVPSASTVYNIIHAMDPGLVMLAQDGTKAYQAHFDLIYRREADHANEVWQADHTPLDIWIMDQTGTPVRPWLTIILDEYSRAVAGYGVSVTAPCAMQTALVLRQAIWRKGDPHWHVCGIPERFYTDHGSDFTSKHLEQVSIDLKIHLIFSEVGQPRGRGKIERFFATINQLFLCEQPGYTPPSTPPATPVLTLAQLQERLHAFLIDTYHQRIQGETKQAPQARWEQTGFLPHLPESLADLDVLLLTVAKPRKVRPDGIAFQGFRYLDPTLAAYVGEVVTIRYDPADMAEIRVYHHHQFLCRAICPPLAGHTVALTDIVHARRQRRRALQQTITDRQTLVNQFLRVHDLPPDAPSIDRPAPSDEPPAAPRLKLKRYTNE